jgi:UDP:flavonoid glycosyltransferase YjiC (YdhE family)
VRVTILTLGSRGDVQPLLGFGAGLSTAGHEVRFSTHPKFEPLVSAVGLEFGPLAEGRLGEGPSTVEGRRWLERGSRRWPAWVGFIRDARSVASRRLTDAVAACEGSDAIVATDLATLLGWQMSDLFGVPLVRARLSPPPPLAQRPIASGVRQGAWIAAQPWLGSMRRDAGLPPLPLREPLGQLSSTRTLELYAFSPEVVPELADVGPWTHVTGYWFLDQRLDPEPPRSLLEFLATGTAPVCIGFGTMLDADPAATGKLVVEALSRAGRRGVIVRGQYGFRGVKLPDSIFALDTIDHGWLFEQCAAVVHHGGAGTVATTLRAGVPSVVVPHMSDQHAWARRVQRLGVSPAPIPRRKLSSERLHEAIALAVTHPGIAERAAALGERIRQESGVERAVEEFAHHLGQAGEPAIAGVSHGNR